VKKNSVVKSLKDIGLEPNHPKGAFYTMVKVPKGYDAQGFAEDAALKAGITVLPSEYFGATVDEKGKPKVVDIYKNPFFDPKIAEQYVRVCYVGNPDKMARGIERLGEAIKIK
jgi:aspartate/methionine/tyrosine aminotransferase